MSHGDRNFITSNTHLDTADQRAADDNAAAMLRAVKELGEYYPVAKQHFTSTIAMIEEVKRQLKSISGATRTEDGKIITGILDLTKFNLSKEQAEHQKQLLDAERESGVYGLSREATLHAVKELGPDFLHAAIDNVGSLQVLSFNAQKQLENIPEEDRRDGGLIKIGLLNLEQLGLTAEQAAARREQIAEMAANPHRYPTVTVAKGFNTPGTEGLSGASTPGKANLSHGFGIV